MRQATITSKRPTGAIIIKVTEQEGGVNLERTSSGWITSPLTSYQLETEYERAVKMLTEWAEGKLAQDALGEWNTAVREWIITGNSPGSRYNPLPQEV